MLNELESSKWASGSLGRKILSYDPRVGEAGVSAQLFGEIPIGSAGFTALIIAGAPVQTELSLNKARSHKYIRRWRGPDGKYRYAYNRSPVARRRRLKLGERIHLFSPGRTGRFRVRALPPKNKVGGNVQIEHESSKLVIPIPRQELESLRLPPFGPSLRPKHSRGAARTARAKDDRARIRRQRRDAREASAKVRTQGPVTGFPARPHGRLKELQGAWLAATLALEQEPGADRIGAARAAGLAYIREAPTPFYLPANGFSDQELQGWVEVQRRHLSTAFPGLRPDEVWEQREALCLAPGAFPSIAIFRDFCIEWERRGWSENPFQQVLPGDRQAYTDRRAAVEAAYRKLEPTPELLRRTGPSAAADTPSEELETRLQLTLGPAMSQHPSLSSWRPREDPALYLLPVGGQKVFVSLAAHEAFRITRERVAELQAEYDEALSTLVQGLIQTFKRVTGYNGTPSFEEMEAGMRELARKVQNKIDRAMADGSYDRVGKVAADVVIKEGPCAAIETERYENFCSDAERHLKVLLPAPQEFLRRSGSFKMKLMLEVNTRIQRAITRADEEGERSELVHLRRLRRRLYHLYEYPDRTHRAVAHDALCKALRAAPIGAGRIEALRDVIKGAQTPRLGRAWVPGGSMALIARLMDSRVFTAAEVHLSESPRSYCTTDNEIHLARSKADDQVLVHEYGHAVEHAHPRLSTASKALVATRSTGEFLRSLKRIRSSTHWAYELAYEDNWRDPYTGRHYLGTPSTEVLSMGLQRLDMNCVGFMLDDPIHALHCLGALFGVYGGQRPIK